MKQILIGAFVGLVTFLVADYTKTTTTDNYRKTLFEAGYVTGIGDAQFLVNELKEDSVKTIIIEQRVNYHWNKIKTLYKHVN